ncbi:uncharacterized protein [Amphiura filiformis]
MYCCDYFGTCASGEEISGKVSSRKITIENHMGEVHKTTWLDTYLDVGQEHIGSWISYYDNYHEHTTPMPASTASPMVSNIADYYVEPENLCTGTNSTHEYGGWYHVALACVENKLNVIGLDVGAEVGVSCGQPDYTYNCNDEMQVCEGKTDLDSGKRPNSTIPEKVTKIHCNKQVDAEILSLDASSKLLSDLDDVSPGNALKLLHGWIPAYTDNDMWVKALFTSATFVAGIEMRGLIQDVERRVDSFKVECEEVDDEGVVTTKWVAQEAEFYAGARLNKKITNYFPGEPIRVRSLIVHVVTPDDPKLVGMRFRPVGCKVCLDDTHCDEEGECQITGKCRYNSGVSAVDPAIVNAGVDELVESGASKEEKGAFLTLLGHGDDETTNGTTVNVNPADVSLVVATSVITALSDSLKLDVDDVDVNSTDDANSTDAADKNGLVVLEKVAGLVDVLSDGSAAVFTQFDELNDTEAAEAAATDMVEQVANLVSVMLSPENSGAWDLLAEKAVADEVPQSDSGTTSPPEKKEPSGSDEATEAEAAVEKAEQKQTAMVEATVNIVSGLGAMASNLVSKDVVQVVTITNDNLEGEIKKESVEELTKDGYKFEADNANLGAKVEIPTINLDLIDEYGEPAKEVVISAIVIDSSAILAAAEVTREAREAANKGSIKNDPGTLVSNLFSFDLLVDGKPRQIPITYTLTHRPASNGTGRAYSEVSDCVFHDTSVKDALVFKQDGLKVTKREHNTTSCESVHQTTFAVMMYLDDYDPNAHHFQIQSKITMACGVVSVIAVAIAIAVFVYLRELLHSERIIIHVTLMSVTGAGMLVFLVGAERKEHIIICKLMTVLLHFLYTAMFSWMLVEGIHLYRQIVTVFESGKSQIWIYFAVGWGIPVVIVAVSTGIQWNKYGKAPICFLDYNDGTLWAFIGPIIPVILINFVVLCRVIQIVVAASKLDSNKSAVAGVRAGVRSSVMLLPLLGLTWVIGYFQHVHPVFAYIFVILNALQGFFMAVFHCFMNTEIRDGLRANVKKFTASSITDKSHIEPTRKNSMVAGTSTATMLGKGNKVTPE